MNEDVYLALSQIAGEVWGTQARATLNQPLPPATPGIENVSRVLGYDVYFEILDRLKADFKKEVTTDETKTPDGEDA